MTSSVQTVVAYPSGKDFGNTVTAQILSVWKSSDDTIWFGFRDDKKTLRVQMNLPDNLAPILARALSIVADGHALNIEIELPS
jgi:hypothetical protein